MNLVCHTTVSSLENNALAGLDMSEEKDNRVDFEFVRDAIENQDQEKMEIVTKDFVRWMKESDEHNGLYEKMVAMSGMSEEEFDAFILEQVVAKAADHKGIQDTLDRVLLKCFVREEKFKEFQDDNQ